MYECHLFPLNNTILLYLAGIQEYSFHSSVSTVEKTSYANDTTANVPGAALSEARNFGGSSGGSNVGYYGGGSAKSIVDKITYSSDTTARIPGADLSGNRSNLTAVGNEDATYFAGGSPGPLTSVDKLCRRR